MRALSKVVHARCATHVQHGWRVDDTFHLRPCRSDPTNHNVYVGNLAANTLMLDLLHHFQQFVDVACIKLYGSCKSGGNALVLFMQHEAAVDAIALQKMRPLAGRVRT